MCVREREREIVRVSERVRMRERECVCVRRVAGAIRYLSNARGLQLE